MPTSTTEAPDPFLLYELAVTSPGPLARFLKALHRKSPRTLGEDFSGSGALSKAWVALGPKLRAILVDTDAAALEKAGDHPRRKKVQADVLKATDRADIIAATNFPICYWHTRKELLRYLRHARKRLSRGGIFVADLYGGPHALKPSKRTKQLKLPDGRPFMYIWDQQTVDPLTSRVFNAIHFKIPSADRDITLRNAFTYDWRLWSIPELRDAMRDAGFKSTEVHDRLGAAVDALGNVYVKAVEEHELDRDYVVYVVART